MFRHFDSNETVPFELTGTFDIVDGELFILVYLLNNRSAPSHLYGVCPLPRLVPTTSGNKKEKYVLFTFKKSEKVITEPAKQNFL